MSNGAPVLIVQPFDGHVRAALGLGIPIVSLVQHGQTFTTLGRRMAERVPTVEGDLLDPSGLTVALTTCRDHFGVQRVVQVSNERNMEHVARAALALGLEAESPHAYRNLNNKAAFLEIATGSGGVRRHWATPDRRETLDALQRHGGPWVLKPADGSGSRGILFAESWEQVAPHLDTEDWVLEEFVPGVEFSVESLSVDGRHQVFGITAKTTSGRPRFIETAHAFPALLPTSTAEAVMAEVIRFLDAATYRNGPAHTEVMLHDDGIDLIESQARLGGDRIPTIVARATGLDPEVELVRSLCVSCAPRTAPRANRAGIRYVELPHGVLRTPVTLSPHGVEQRLEVHPIAVPGTVLGEATSSSQRHVAVIGPLGPRSSPDEISTRPLRAVVTRPDSDPSPTMVLFGGTDEQLTQCVALGHRPLLVQAHDQLTPAQIEASAACVICDVGERANVDWVAAQLSPYVHLPFVSVRQYATLLRALVCEHLSIEPGSSVDTSENTSDKVRLRERIDQLGLPTPRWLQVTSAAQARRALVELGGKAALKVARGTGGVGVRMVDGGTSISLTHLAARVDDVLPGGVTSGGFLIEEALAGPLFSVESVWVQGTHIPLGVTTSEVSTESSAELRHTFPGNMPDTVRQEAFAQVDRLLGSMGMYSGGTHVEFILTDSGPVIIDAHDRPAGGLIPELVEHVLGVSSTRVAIAAQTGQLTVEQARRLQADKVAVVQFVTTRIPLALSDREVLANELVNIASIDGVAQAHVTLTEDTIRAEIDNWTRPGYVITTGGTVLDAEHVARSAADRLARALHRASEPASSALRHHLRQTSAAPTQERP